MNQGQFEELLKQLRQLNAQLAELRVALQPAAPAQVPKPKRKSRAKPKPGDGVEVA